MHIEILIANEKMNLNDSYLRPDLHDVSGHDHDESSHLIRLKSSINGSYA